MFNPVPDSDDDHFSDASEGRYRTTSPSRELDDPPMSPDASPAGYPVPRTAVEKLDPDEAADGEEPDTTAYKSRKLDATPDLILETGESDPDRSNGHPQEATDSGDDTPVPDSPSRVDSLSEQTSRPSDAVPDAVEEAPENGGT